MNVRMICVLVSAFMVVMILTAMTEVTRNRRGLEGRVIIGAPSVALRTIPDDLAIKKAKGSFKYKSEDEADAQQGWILAGEVPTTHTSFDTINEFQVQGQEPGTPYALEHMFYKDSAGVKGRNNDRLKQKFTYYTTRSEGHQSFPSYGFFKAAIKDGKMQFMYSIKKASEGQLLVGMDEYTALHDGMSDQKPYKESGVPFECGLSIDGDAHGQTGEIAFKATKAKGKGIVQ